MIAYHDVDLDKPAGLRRGIGRIIRGPTIERKQPNQTWSPASGDEDFPDGMDCWPRVGSKFAPGKCGSRSFCASWSRRFAGNPRIVDADEAAVLSVELNGLRHAHI